MPGDRAFRTVDPQGHGDPTKEDVAMGEHPNVAVINRMTQAIFEHDRDTLEQVFTPGFTFHMRGPLPRPGDHAGVDGLLTAIGAIFELTDGDVKIEQLFCVAEGAAAAEWEHAVLGRNGRTLETKNAFVYEFEGDRIAEMWMICAAPPGSETFWD
jgi:ketosteroid isomerase-like protein